MNLTRHHLTSTTSSAGSNAVADPGRHLQPATGGTRDAENADAGFRSSRLRGLHPGWFGGVMGTGVLALAAYQNPGSRASLLGTAHVAGDILAVIAVVLAIALTIAYIARWVVHFDAALSDLRHPVLGPLYGLFPGGLLIVAVLVSTMGPALLPAGAITPTVATLAIIGTVLSFAIAATFTYLLFTGETDAQAVNGGWLIPPVVNIIVPLTLMPLLAHVGPSTGRLLMALSYAFFGIGFFLFILVISMVHDRLVLHPMPHASLAPSLWIFLGPIGAGSLALLALAKGGAQFFGPAAPVVGLLTLLFVSAFWGFGLWALTAAALMLTRYLREGPLPYGLGWWGFTFPIGAYTVATFNIGRAWQSGWIEGFAAVLFVVLAVFWLIVAGRTLWAVATGEVWAREDHASGRMADAIPGTALPNPVHDAHTHAPAA